MLGAVFSPDEGMQMDWSEGLELLVFKIDERSLRSYFLGLGEELDPADSLRFAPRMTVRAALSGLMSCARLVDLAVREPAGTASISFTTPIFDRFCDQVMTTLYLTQPWRADRRPRVARGQPLSQRAAHQARELVEAGRTVPAAPSELAARTGVSLRNLEVGFRSEFGTTPQVYLTRTRLRRAHSDLRQARAGEGTTVAAIAERWGFTNVGRFARQYAHAYGQRPSETLADGLTLAAAAAR